MAARRLAMALLLVAAGAAADEPKPASPAEARIVFADKSIWNWQVIDNRTVLIETTSHQWYKATLLSPCIDLPFAEKIGFQSNADGSFDKFSAIEAAGAHCPLISLEAAAAPAKAAKHEPAAASSAKP